MYRFLHHKSVGPLAIDPPKPIHCDTSLLFRLLRENGVLDDFLVAGRDISVDIQVLISFFFPLFIDCPLNNVLLCSFL
jgi:hypothetical protein